MATSAYGTASMNNVFTGQPQTLCEASLVSAARRGHQAAFGELCQRHAKRVFRTMLRITRNREDAEDAVQDSFLQAFVHLEKFDGRSTFSTWLTRIAINSALMILRRRRKASFVSLDDAGDPNGTETCLEVTDQAVDPERRCLEQERKRVLRDAIRTLRPSARRVIELQQLEERPYKGSCSRNRYIGSRSQEQAVSRQGSVAQIVQAAAVHPATRPRADRLACRCSNCMPNG